MRHNISIHALLAESDTFGPARLASGAYFYPRSPCGERLRAPNHNSCLRNNFYPRSPCGERQRRQNRLSPNRKISIHALLAESDVIEEAITFYPPVFLSTLSLRRATHEEADEYQSVRISIHALLAESDGYRRSSHSITLISIHALLAESDEIPNQCKIDEKNFYPRSPCGERQFLRRHKKRAK